LNITLSASAEELRKKFFVLETAGHIAELLEIDHDRLKYHLYIVPLSQRYSTFDIPKKFGGVRTISAPVTALKIIQQKLNQVLQSVYPRKPSAHGFVYGMSILTNAQEHSKRRWVFNVDLKDFFPSINFGRVRGMFMAFPYQRNPAVATVLAQICCFNNALPQGAPTSPIVSNMICAKMDSEFQLLAQEHRCFYTRYGDDITFSTFLPRFPPALGSMDSSGRAQVGPILEEVIRKNGFQINPNKVRLQIKNRRQVVTGLTINKFPNVRREYVRQIRAMLHAWRKFGVEAAEEEFFKTYDQKHRGPSKSRPLFKQVVKGKIEFLGMVRGKINPIYLRFRHQLRTLAPELVKEPENPLELLLKEYDGLSELQDQQKRGYLLQGFLNRVFKLYAIPVRESFMRNERGEQIDGAFKLDGWFYVVECRWRKKLADIQELDGLMGKLVRSGRQTMGFFLSINGWSRNVRPLLKENPIKSIVLMDGDDLRGVLSEQIDLRAFILKKVEMLNLDGEPFYSASQYLKETRSQPVRV
jgi:RNA-directed DNA polymerase